MFKLILILALTIFQTNCMTLQALEMEFTLPTRVKCVAEGEVVYDGTPSGVLRDGSSTYIKDMKTGKRIKTQATCTYYY